MKNALYFALWCFYSWDLSIFVLIFGHAGKKGKIYFKICDVTKWITSNYSTHIAKYLKKWRQSDNEIWSVNRIQLEKHFCWKIIHKLRWRNYSQTFSKNLNLSISLDQQCKVLYPLFLLHVQVEGYQKILKLRCRSFAFT